MAPTKNKSCALVKSQQTSKARNDRRVRKKFFDFFFDILRTLLMRNVCACACEHRQMILLDSFERENAGDLKQNCARNE